MENKLSINTILITVLAIIPMIYGCAATKYPVKGITNYEDLVNFANTKNFEIQNKWANPMRANSVTFINDPNFSSGNVNLIGNTNYIKFKGDSVDIYLPYFGTRQMGGGYNDRSGIKFKGVPQDIEIIENRNKGYVRFEFSANDDTENYQFFITLYTNGNASTSVNSSQRDNISYSGNFARLKIEQEQNGK